MKLTLNMPVVELYAHDVAKLSAALARKLAVAVAGYAGKSDVEAVTVEDLLNYFPLRYEDRSRFISIDQLENGMEAAVEIYTKVSGGFRVGKNRGPRQPPLFIFEISGADERRTQKPVVVKWFVSGKQAERIVAYYAERFSRGTRFVAYGKWEWDIRLNTFALMVSKPEELEILPVSESPVVTGGFFDAIEHPPDTSGGSDTEDPPDTWNCSDAGDSPDTSGGSESDEDLADDFGDPEFAPIHTARRVPIYRKLGPFQTKRLREIIHSVLEKIDRTSIPENLPADLLIRQNLATRGQAISEIHFPPENSSIAEYEMFRSPAHKRLIFEEFFWLSLAMQLVRGERRK